ncbi:hypothetical protein PR003_g1384 [Phytophthora rubi]|uniref:RING-type domain-containing protein n=1 Tax=Phytophthora rubi TaxID=129364 RepID=A0A6A4G8F4_9STRA|nr:hypothetical protein PR003_g1384 [Phytophthora rubi]
MSADTSLAAGDEDDAYSPGVGLGEEAKERDEDARRQLDDGEEKTAEANADEEFFASGHFQADDGAWDGFETAYNVHLQLASGTQSVSCPICLRVTQVPVHQDCGHVLCFYCTQQSFAALGDCPLCQAQQIFKAGKSDLLAAPVMGMPTSSYSYAGTRQDLHVPIAPLSGIHHNNGYTGNTSVSWGFGASRAHYDLLSSSGDASLQLDNFSDIDDVIDLDDLVSSDSERPSPAVAARTSLSGSFVPGPPRSQWTSFRKMSGGSFGCQPVTEEVVNSMPAIRTRTPTSQTGKRKARSRKIKREELAIAHLEWETIKAEGTAPDPRYDCGLALYGSLLIVVGGIVGKLRLNDLHILDLASNHTPKWIQPPISGTPPSPGNLLQIFIIEDTLYAIGGTIDGKFLTELHALNLNSGDWKWEKIKVAGTPPSMRYWYSLTVLRGMAILYGGYGHPQRLSDTFALRFDMETPTWVQLKPRGDIPGPSSTHSSCVINDHMYIFGGYDGKYRRGQLFAFEIESMSEDAINCVWRKVGTLGGGPAPRYTHSGVSIGSQLIVYGGNTGCLKGEAYVLDVDNVGTGDDVPTWKLVKSDPPLIPRAWHRAVVYNDAILTAATSYSSSASGSGSTFVEFSSSSDAAEIRFPTNDGTGSADAHVVAGVSSGDGSLHKLEIAAYPLVTEPLLVLSAMKAASSGSIAQEEAVSSATSSDVADSSSGDSSLSAALTEEMHGVPSNPTLVNAVAFDGRAAVTWKAPDDDGLDAITAYEVGWFDEEDNILVGTQRVTSASVKVVNHTGNTSISTGAIDSVPMSTVVEPLVNGRSYTFKVRAHNVNGFSVWSAKSLAVSSLHPPDLCERLSCSGHGTCFPNYHNEKFSNHRQRRDLSSHLKDSNTAIDEYSMDALCICRPGYSPPDCSAKTSEDEAQYVWKETEWSECDSGCGGGRRSRKAICFDLSTDQKTPSEEVCTGMKPSVTDICNGIECGSKRVVVKYEVEMSYDEVLFSPTAMEAFELAFTTEVASALQIPRSRLEISALERGSIVVFFQILPASRVGEKSLNDIVENLQYQLDNETSILRSMGTFARHVEPNGAKFSYSIADQTVAGGAEDISIAGLIGTMIVLGFFVSMFGWFLRRRHRRLLKDRDGRMTGKFDPDATDMETSGSGMKRMNIKSMP